MTAQYKLSSHQRYPQLRFAFVDGDHKGDFGMHCHDFSELFIVLSGKGLHRVGAYQYPLQVGDVFVINGDIEHGFEQAEDLKLVNLMFDAAHPFFELPTMRKLSGYQALFKVEPLARQTSEYRAKLTLPEKDRPEINALLDKIKCEYQDANAGFEIMIGSLMQQLVTLLARRYQSQQGDLPATTLAFSRALVFIEQNFTDPEMTSETIAKQAFISKRQLERLFRQFFATSPTRYIRQLQLNYAKTVLRSGEKLSIQWVAEQCGFGDANYFSRCFKSEFQISPKEFRKSSAEKEKPLLLAAE